MRTGSKVPRPTSSVISAISIFRARMRCEDFGREVQACGGRGYGASLPRVDGLIAFAVGGFVGAFDVGRQRDVA